MSHYTAITFSPVQGFIEKSRKLRDLSGASLILSYLTHALVVEARRKSCEIISPGLPNLQKGMPNRILLKESFSYQETRGALLAAWKCILKECRLWLENHLQQNQYYWKKNWNYCGSHSWEIFWSQGTTPEAAMMNLEQQKLARNWTGVNWIGESSSLTGTDAIAYPEMNQPSRTPKRSHSPEEKEQMASFYRRLAELLEKSRAEENQEDTPVGKFLAPSERLSIPELVKRLVTWWEIRETLNLPRLKSFSDLVRIPENRQEYFHSQWTGWFMGDGDRVGEHLKQLSRQENRDYALRKFSVIMRRWGQQFERNFPQDLGRIVYAGGDDFLGVIYNRHFPKNSQDSISGKRVLEWLEELPKQWRQHQQEISLSLGFVWAGAGVPQRDVLQHCREAVQRAKSLGRDRLTIRVVFNGGQFIEWTCPWCVLSWFREYQDRDGIAYKDRNYQYYQNRKAQLKLILTRQTGVIFTMI